MFKAKIKLRTVSYRWNDTERISRKSLSYYKNPDDKKLLELFCVKHAIKIYREVVDNTPLNLHEFEDLPGLKDIFKLASRSEIDLVLISRLNVFGPSVVGLYKIIKTLDSFGVRVQCVDEPFSVHKNNGRLIICPEEKEL